MLNKKEKKKVLPYESSRPESFGIIFYAEFAHRFVGILFRLSACGN